MHNVFAVCRDPVIFPDPEEFRPERSERINCV